MKRCACSAQPDCASSMPQPDLVGGNIGARLASSTLADLQQQVSAFTRELAETSFEKCFWMKGPNPCSGGRWGDRGCLYIAGPTGESHPCEKCHRATGPNPKKALSPALLAVAKKLLMLCDPGHTANQQGRSNLFVPTKARELPMTSAWHTIREWRRRSRSRRELRMLSELERRDLAYKSFWQAGIVSLGVVARPS
jgi:uncharacterized protein YjiS (DUF1127 family)